MSAAAPADTAAARGGNPLALLADDMRAVDGVIAARLSTSVPLIAQIAGYIIAAGGKRLRPALLLMVCKALGYAGHNQYLLAAVIELIHTATLLHDDVVDESTLRRGRATANQAFGNPASVLVGDFLHSRAFQMMVEAGNPRVLQILSHATNVIAEGEVQQLVNTHNAALTEAGYLEVVRSKTAKLFEASAQIGAVLAAATPPVEQACAEYGQALGTAFQIVDDVLDYTGDAHEMGKNLGDDLREGKCTLPLIAAMQRAAAADAAIVRAAVEQGSTEQLDAVITIVRASGALQAARHAAHREAQRAMQALHALPQNLHTANLLQLAASLLQRRA